jgi:flagellin
MVSFSSNISGKIQRQLGLAGNTIQSSFERLSSGLRINKASDGAAGLAVAATLNVKGRLYSQGVRNINDGISALNIVESALQSQSNIVIRLKELAAQSANGVYSYSQRQALNIEYQSLVREFGRIGDSSKFNGINLLLGGRGLNIDSINIQAGINGGANSTISAELGDSGSLSGVMNVGVKPVDAQDLFGLTSYIDEAINIFAGHRTTIIDSAGNERDILVAVDAGGGQFNGQVWIRADQSNGSFSSDPEQWVNVGAFSLFYNQAEGKFTGSTRSNF